MNNFYTLLCLALCFFLSDECHTQTILIDPAGGGGFENGTTFADNGWTEVNYASGAKNNFYVGNPTGGANVPNPTGANCSYLAKSSDPASWDYTNTATSTVHFFQDVTFPTGETIINLSFNWKNRGESGWDRLLVYISNTSSPPMLVAGTPASSNTTLTGYTLISGTSLHSSWSNWNTANIAITASQAGNASAASVRRILFTWQNDNSTGTTPPGAIDEISLISQAPPPPPANDDCDGATVFPVSPFVNCSYTQVITTSATQSTPAASCTTSGTDDDVWFTIIPAYSGTHTIRYNSLTATSGMASTVGYALYAGSCGSLTQISCNTGFGSGGSGANTTSSLTAGTTYYLRMWVGNSPNSGTWNLCVEGPLPNDNPAGAIALTPGVPVTLNTTSATQTLAACVGNADDDVWFTFAPPSDGAYTLSFAGLSGTLDVVYEIFLGDPTNGGTSLGCHDGPDSGASHDGYVAGNTYFIRVHSYTTTDITGGTMTISSYAGSPPANNDCANALSITPSPIGNCTYTGLSSAGGTFSLGKPSCILTYNPPAFDDDIWMVFTSSVAGIYNFKTSEPGTYGLELYTGTCGNLTALPSSCTSGFSGTTGVSRTLSASTTYYLRMWNAATVAGSAFNLCVEAPSTCYPPANLNVTDITHTAATLGWDAVASAVSYDWEVVPSANAQGVGVVASGNSANNTVQATGLAPGTSYKFYVRANCTGESSAYSVSANFIISLNCSTATDLVCASPTNAVIATGSGAYNSTICPPSSGTATGRELLYSLTAPVSGNYYIQVTAASGGGISYYHREASTGCGSTGWICIFNTSTTGTSPAFTLSGGVEYLFLLDATGTGGRNHTFQLNCPCSGTPSPGNTISTANTVCPGENFTLSLQNATPGLGVAYQWQSSSDGSNWSDISGATSPTYAATQLSTTFYQCNVTCSGSTGTSNALQVTMASPTNCYCMPIYSTGCGSSDRIDKVILGSLTNPASGNSGCTNTNATGYTQYLSNLPVPDLEQLISHPISVAVGPGGIEHVKVFIDYNQDGDFDETGEEHYIGFGNGTTVSGSITVPLTASLGQTRMRVRLVFNSSTFTACSSAAYGETEDYWVNITPASNCQPPTSLTATAITSGSASLSWTDPNAPPATNYDVEILPASGTATGTPSHPAVGNPFIVTGLAGSTAYKYFVRGNCSGGTGNWAGPYNFTTSIVGDNLSEAILLSVDAPCFGNIYTNTGATAEAGENTTPPCWFSTGSAKTVWFKFVAPASGSVLVSTDIPSLGTLTDSHIAVYAGPASGPDYTNVTTVVACDEDGGSLGSGYMGVASASLTPGNTYYVQVSGYNGAAGSFCIQVLDGLPAIPAAPSCASTITVSNVSGNDWINFQPMSSGQVVMAIHPNGQNLGNVTVSSYKNNSGNIRKDGNNVNYLDRNWAVTSSAGPASPVGVRVFFTDAELATLIVADGGTNSISDYKISHIVAGGCTTTIPANGELINQTGNFDLIGGNAYIEFSTPSFSGFYISSGQSALPVELLYFKGEAMNAGNKLTWATASEQNSRFHIVKRLADGSGDWREVGRLSSAGTSLEEKSYSFLDRQPPLKSYYRLHSVDLDGQEQFSNIVVVERAGDRFAVSNMFPIPSEKEVTLQVNLPEASALTLTLTDISGKTRAMHSFQGNEGINDLKIDLENFPSGIYFVQISDGISKITEKVLKQ